MVIFHDDFDCTVHYYVDIFVDFPLFVHIRPVVWVSEENVRQNSHQLGARPSLEKFEAAQDLQSSVVEIPYLISQNFLEDLCVNRDAVDICKRYARGSSLRAVEHSELSKADSWLDDSHCIFIHELLRVLVPSLYRNSDVAFYIEIDGLGEVPPLANRLERRVIANISS